MTTHQTDRASLPADVGARRAAITLPGQAAATPGAVDMTMMYVMHHGFRRDLAAFADAAVATPVSARATWEALGRRWELSATILHGHHAGEDAGLWPALRARTDDAGRQVLDAMEAEHDEIDPLLARCAGGLARLADTADEEVRAALAEHLERAQAVLDAHLAHEETHAVPLLQQLLTVEDWQAIDDEYFKKALPLSTLLELVPWALRGLTPGQRAEVFERIRGPHRLIWAATRRRFAARERAAFRYAL